MSLGGSFFRGNPSFQTPEWGSRLQSGEEDGSPAVIGGEENHVSGSDVEEKKRELKRSEGLAARRSTSKFAVTTLVASPGAAAAAEALRGRPISAN